MISVIVPTLNEEARLPACLDALARQAGLGEVIVTDGGSVDGTVAVARERGARVVSGAAGRARQLNAGAALAAGSVFWFVHADTLVPSHAGRAVHRAVADGMAGGAFSMRFDTNRAGYVLASCLADAYCRRTRDFFGDRAMFITRDAFQTLEGFRPLPLMEDLDLAVRLRRAGFATALLNGPVLTSHRRFARRGLWRGMWLAARLTWEFHRHKSAHPHGADYYLSHER